MGKDAERAEQGGADQSEISVLAEAVRKAVTDPRRLRELRRIVRGAAQADERLDAVRRVREAERRAWEAAAHKDSPELLDPEKMPVAEGVVFQRDEHRWRVGNDDRVLPIWVPRHLHSSRKPPRGEVLLVRRGPGRDQTGFTRDEALLVAAVVHDWHFREMRVESIDPWRADPGLDTEPAPGLLGGTPLRPLMEIWYAHLLDQIRRGVLWQSEWSILHEAVDRFGSEEPAEPALPTTVSAQEIRAAHPTSLAAKNRAAHDLAANLRDILGWFDALRAADRDQPPEPVPDWWDGYVRDRRWAAEPRAAPPNRADRLRWASGRTIDTIGGVEQSWDRLAKVIPLPESERPLLDAARQSLGNLRCILEPMQGGPALRLGAIPARWHLREPLPDVWEPEAESDAEREAFEKGQDAAFEAASKKGSAKAAAKKRLDRAKAEHLRLVEERGKRNTEREAQARAAGLVTADERALLEAARARWEEQIARWELGEKDMRDLLERLDIARGPQADPSARTDESWTLLPRPAAVKTAIDALINVDAMARCVAVGIEEGRRWGWQNGDPRPLPPVPPVEVFVAAERRRFEADGVQTWSPRHQADAEASWEDQREAHADWDRQRERCREWRMVLLADWHELQTRLLPARDAVAAIREPLAGVVVHPGQWISEASALLGNLGALGVRWGERPWVGDVDDLLGPLAELMRRCHYLQNAEFAFEGGRTPDGPLSAGDAVEEREKPKETPSGPARPLAGWTAVALRRATKTATANPIGDTTFRRLRDASGIKGGVKGRLFTPDEVRAMMARAPEVTPQESDRIVSAWTRLLKGQVG